MRTAVRIRRREFLVAGAGGGLALGFSLGSCRGGRRAAAGLAPDAWLTIGADGGVTVTVARSEMGQGVWTALPMIVAEELEADWESVGMRPAPADRERYGRQRTGGSLSVRTSWLRLRRVGATAREMLLSAAAQSWGAPRRECRAERGEVIHEPTGRRLKYGALAAAAARLPLPAEVELNDPREFRIVGREARRFDTPGKVDGSAAFGADTRRPKMKYAVLARCPMPGGTLKSYDDDAARRVAGVIDVVESGGAVAVVGETTWAAIAGREALRVEWDGGGNATLSSDSIRERLAGFPERPAAVMQARGNVEKALPRCARLLSSVYEVPFLAHAPLEPMNCTADVRSGRCEIWVPSQDLDDVQDAAARITGLARDRVVVHHTLIGGGFGRRLLVDYAGEAVRLSRSLQSPVQVFWSREDDLRNGFYHPMSHHRLRGGLDGNGWPAVWEHHLIAPSILRQLGHDFEGSEDREVRHETTSLYGFRHMAIGYTAANTPVPVGWMRSVYNMPNGFAEESFLDELAAAGGKDPLEVRLRLLDGRHRVPEGWSAGRLRGVLAAAAEKAGWGKPAAPGLHRGLACQGVYLSYCAAVAEVSMADGKPRVHRVVAAVDCGAVVNPDTVRAQVEGGIVFALSNALYGEISIRDGRVRQSNFHDYPVLRIGEAPRIEVHIVPSGEPPTGIGEIAVPAVAPAVANAIFAATGKRLRRLPLAPPGGGSPDKGTP